MRTWALVHGDTITRVQQSEQNPFPAGLRAVEVTGIPAQAGNRVDAQGNVGPSSVMAPAAAAAHRRGLLTGEREFRAVSGVWLPAGDPDGALFGAAPSDLALLAALAAGGSSTTPSADGRLIPVKAADVLKAVGKHMAACYANEAKLAEDPDADQSEGWPDNGEPDQKADHTTPAVAAVRQPGTGIVPEQTLEQPHASPTTSVVGTVEAPVVQTGA